MKTPINIFGTIALSLFLFSCASTKSLTDLGVTLIEGSDLYYEVNQNGNTYPFTLNMNHYTNTTISFDWELDERSHGAVFMSEEALNSATDLMNYFKGGYSDLEDKTSVWVSKKLFSEIKDGKKVKIGLDGGNHDIFELSGKDQFTIKNKKTGQTIALPVLILKGENNNQIWIADDFTNRLIVKMDIGFEIHLMAIE